MRNTFIDVVNTLNQHGHPITSVFDIGANQGKWTAKNEKLFSTATIALFEANSKHQRPKGLHQRHSWFNVVLSDPDTTEVEFYTIARGPRPGTGDSYYKENTAFYDGVVPITLKTITMDEFVVKHNISAPQIIKLDTQGSEIDILKGATETLKTVDVIQIETPILAYNKGAPGFDDYLEYIMLQGFVPVGVDEVHINDNILMQLDIVYLRKELREKYYDVRKFWRGIEQ